MVVLGKAVGFVADVLEQAECEGAAFEAERSGRAGDLDFFFAMPESVPEITRDRFRADQS